MALAKFRKVTNKNGSGRFVVSQGVTCTPCDIPATPNYEEDDETRDNPTG